jgi:hypothetical protein
MKNEDLIKERLSIYGDVIVKELKNNLTIEISNIDENKTTIFICIGTTLDVYFDEYSKIDKITCDNGLLSIKLKK